jgi:23S rRNA pseudouridine1911/1915/1917 synthase
MPWRVIAIDRGDIGTRIDRVLLRHLRDVPGISRNRIQRLVTTGAVLVNGGPAPRAAWRVAAGDDVRVDLPEARPRQIPKPERVALDILYEDDDLIVVNKPAGMVAHPAFRNASGTLINALLYHARSWPPPARPSLVLRLDKDTSGLVLVAKRATVHAALQEAMRANRVEKEYLAVVAGRPTPARGTIDLALDRDPWDERRVIVRDRGGVPSVTRFERLRSMGTGSDALSLLRCRLVTGRTHQIRVHLSSKGWPIVGDAVYGGVRRASGSAPLLERQALHSWRVAFAHPSTDEWTAVTAPLPADMERLLTPRP